MEIVNKETSHKCGLRLSLSKASEDRIENGKQNNMETKTQMWL